MTPERWAEIERLYHAALPRTAGDRAAFLEDACGTDQELLREVESLLKYEPQAAAFLESADRRPAWLRGRSVGGVPGRPKDAREAP